jgi:molybdopterin converting factor small subunit
LYASLRNRKNGSDSGVVTVDVPDGISLGELLDEMELDIKEVDVMRVNDINSDAERVLFDGDLVDLFPAGFSKSRDSIKHINTGSKNGINTF